MSLETTTLERRMFDALTEEMSVASAEKLRALYTTARDRLVNKVLPLTVVATPELTDHTAAHVERVLDNANRLIAADAFGNGTTSGAGNAEARLSAVDGYTLCMAILIHDAGMVYGREGHEQRIGAIYDWLRGDSRRPLQEKYLLHWIAGAHTGQTGDGRQDKIAEVPEAMELCGRRVQARELAAILRFADELAEGPHRTNSFLTGELGISEKSDVYHQYSEITSTHIDRRFGRIALTYHREIERHEVRSPKLRELITFILARVIKVDRERRYTRFYSDQLAPFRKTDVKLNFWAKGRPIDFGPLELSAPLIHERSGSGVT